MDMNGERLIAAPRADVWTALNDPEVLKACIPGCDSLEKLSDTQMKATAAIKLGPVAAKFAGKLNLSDLDPPNGYKISGEGQGGPAGFAKGGAEVKLVEEAGGTLLSYTVKAQVGGKIAQVGGRLIDATAKSMADQFFAKFAERVEKPPEPETAYLDEGLKSAGKPGLLASLLNFLKALLGGKAKAVSEGRETT